MRWRALSPCRTSLVVMPPVLDTLTNAKKAPPWRLIVVSAVAILLAAVTLGLLAREWGTPVLYAGYITLMFLAPAVRVLPVRGLVLGGLWAMLICVVSVLVAPHGPWALLGIIVATALVQGLFAVNGKAGVNRSPASVVGFAAFADTGGWDEVWQPMVGVVVGVAVVLAIALALAANRGPDGRHLDAEPAPLASRLYYGGGLACGSAILTVLFTLAGWGGLSYALLIFCLIYAFDSDKVLHNSLVRVVGAVVGVVASVLLSWLLPQPALIVLFVVCAVIALASLLDHHEFWYVVFLIATVVHLAEVTGKGALSSGLEHILGVIVAAAVAVVLYWVATPLHERLVHDPRYAAKA